MLASIFDAMRVVFKSLTCIIYRYVIRKSETCLQRVSRRRRSRARVFLLNTLCQRVAARIASHTLTSTRFFTE